MDAGDSRLGVLWIISRALESRLIGEDGTALPRIKTMLRPACDCPEDLGGNLAPPRSLLEHPHLPSATFDSV